MSDGSWSGLSMKLALVPPSLCCFVKYVRIGATATGMAREPRSLNFSADQDEYLLFVCLCAANNIFQTNHPGVTSFSASCEVHEQLQMYRNVDKSTQCRQVDIACLRHLHGEPSQATLSGFFWWVVCEVRWEGKRLQRRPRLVGYQDSSHMTIKGTNQSVMRN